MRRGFSIAGVLGLAIIFLTLATSSAAEKPGGEDKKADAPNTVERRQLLESVGALASGQLYQTYLNLGLLADGVAEGTYEAKDIREVLQTALGLLELQDKHLARIGKLDLTAKDCEGLNKLRKLGVLLRQQAEELDAYWKTADKEHGARYEKARQEAWAGLSSLLGLKK